MGKLGPLMMYNLNKSKGILNKKDSKEEHYDASYW